MEYGLYMKHCKVEVYLLEFKLSLHPNTNENTVQQFSRSDTVGTLWWSVRPSRRNFSLGQWV